MAGSRPIARSSSTNSGRAGSAIRASSWTGGQQTSATDDGCRSIRIATHIRRAEASMAVTNGPIASMS